MQLCVAYWRRFSAVLTSSSDIDSGKSDLLASTTMGTS